MSVYSTAEIAAGITQMSNIVTYTYKLKSLGNSAVCILGI
jgi:hypothetical protein